MLENTLGENIKSETLDDIIKSLEPNRIELEAKINRLIDEFESTHKVNCLYKTVKHRIHIGILVNPK